MFINIHTHQPTGNRKKEILNLYKDFERVKDPGYYSIGIHPWYIGNDPDTALKELAASAQSSSVLAIGETGLDKISKTDLVLQEKVFRFQLQLAVRLQKPLIIHCVRAWNEITHILDQEKPAIPVIFHGFNKGITLAIQLCTKGYYLSFGKALEKDNTRQVLKNIPPHLFFLETDDDKIPIPQVYEWASNALTIDLNALDLQIQKNAAAVFGPNVFL